MTPLQQAAQSALDRYESVRYASLITPQVIESQMLDLSKALEDEQAQAVEHKPRDRIADAGKTMGERAALIHHLRGVYADSQDVMDLHAADMLEADAREIEATERQVEILSDELSKCGKAQQVAAPVPMTDKQSFDLWESGCSAVSLSTFRSIMREIETSHGIGAKT